MNLYKKIKELYWSLDNQDKQLAIDWLTQLLGDAEANANIFVMELCKNYDDDSDIILSNQTFATMIFKTLTSCYGKNYYYDVHFKASFMGEVILDYSKNYSRNSVGSGYPKDNMIDNVCKYLRAKNLFLHNELLT